MTAGKASIVAALVLLVLGGFFLGFSGSVDDAHITFHAAQVLATEGEILNYNFDRVEQSSALLQVLLLALLQLASSVFMVALPIVTLAHITTGLAAIGALFFTARIMQRILPVSVFTAPVLLASSPFFLYWAFSGMEGPLLACLLLLFLLAIDSWLHGKQLLLTVFCVSLAAQMTRPEMPWVLCAFALLLLMVRAMVDIPLWRWKALWLLLLLQVTCVAALASWRYGYFSDVFPQPVRAKVGEGFWPALQQGLQYTQQTLFAWPVALFTVLAAAGAVLVLRRWREPLVLMSTLLLCVYGAFVIASGGDWMAAGRFWVPVMPLMAMLVALLLHKCGVPALLRNGLLCLLVAGNVTYLWRGSAVDFNGVPLWKTSRLVDADHASTFSFFERHAREHLHDIPTLAFIRPLIGKLIAVRGTPENPATINIMAGQMGMVPFYLVQDFGKQLHFFDRNGITERTLTRCAPAAHLPRTRNGIGTGYQWIIENRIALESQCGFVMPDVVFDIETGWNRSNIAALEQAGYVFVYRQRGHIVDEPDDALLPLRKIGAGQFIAISHTAWQQLSEPAPQLRVF